MTMIARDLAVVLVCALMSGLSPAQRVPRRRHVGIVSGWLRSAPTANGPLELLQGFAKASVAKGTAAADAERELNTVMRLMRDR